MPLTTHPTEALYLAGGTHTKLPPDQRSTLLTVGVGFNGEGVLDRLVYRREKNRLAEQIRAKVALSMPQLQRNLEIVYVVKDNKFVEAWCFDSRNGHGGTPEVTVLPFGINRLAPLKIFDRSHGPHSVIISDWLEGELGLTAQDICTAATSSFNAALDDWVEAGKPVAIHEGEAVTDSTALARELPELLKRPISMDF